MKPVRKQIADLLRRIDDPELGINIVDLGLIYDLQFDGGRIEIKMTMTTPACPLSDTITGNIRRLMERVGGVDALDVKIVWNPAWAPEMMDPDIRAERFHRPLQHLVQYR